MNIFLPKERLLNDGSNFKSVIAEIADDVARTIIMVETGMRHFVDGKIDPNPKPMFTKRINGCTINMKIMRASLVLLLPKHLDFNTYLMMFISQIDMQLHHVETELKIKPTILIKNNQFAMMKREYTPKVGSLFLPQGVANQITKRIFVVNEVMNKVSSPNTAFLWSVSNDIRIEEFTNDYYLSSLWFADQSAIIVNLTDIPIHLFTSHAQLIDINIILGRLGVTNIVKYAVRGVNRVPERKNLINNINNEAKYSSVAQRYLSDNDEKQFVSIRRAEKEQITDNDCLSAFLGGDYEPGALHYACQICNMKQTEKMYALVRRAESSVESVYMGICPSCMHSSNAFLPLVDLKLIIKYSVDIHFSTTCEDYGVPKSHLALIKSPKFVNRKYIRNARTFALSPVMSVCSIALIGEIVKFRDSVSNGEFIIAYPMPVVE